MNQRRVIQFNAALKRGDDASALSLLNNGRVSIDSVLFWEADGVRLQVPLICIAVRYVREKVVRALVWLGASIDSFRDGGNPAHEAFVTPAGDAISKCNIPALSLCLRLGADLTCVYRTAESPPTVRSGLEFAIREAKEVPLAFLLDELHTARPVRLREKEIEAFFILVKLGSPAKSIFEVLGSRGFNFKVLEEIKCGSRSGELPGATSAADTLLSLAQKSGGGDLLRYLLKDLGLVTTAARMESLKDIVDGDVALDFSDGVSPPRADLKKYICESCEVVGETSFCSFCKDSRYCSKKCQRRHWKTGGHKQECKNIQRRMRSKDRGEEGSSGTAG